MGNNSNNLWDVNNKTHYFSSQEQFPVRLSFVIIQKQFENKLMAITYCDNLPIGDPLTDNAYFPDGYRFHDVFHISYMAILGWSPVLRKQLNRKRKSHPKIDEVEDGGRATAIEEGISALIFSYAKKCNFFEGSRTIAPELIQTLKYMTNHLEVAEKTAQQWEMAILKGYEVWRLLMQHGQGEIRVDLEKSTLTFQTFSDNHGDREASGMRNTNMKVYNPLTISNSLDFS